MQAAAGAEGAVCIELGEPLAGRFELIQVDDTDLAADEQRVPADAVDGCLRSLLEHS